MKILHIADVHLEHPFSGESPHIAAVRRKESLEAFERAVNLAMLEEVDLVLIAGDFFDRKNIPIAVAQRVFSIIEASGLNFVLSPGNHDFYTPDSIYNHQSVPKNLHIFKKEKIEEKIYETEKERVRVCGYAFTSPSVEAPPFRGYTPSKDGAINILVAHGNMYASSIPDCPIKMSDIQNSGFDYIALGHIHNSPEIKREGNVYYGYSGSLEPLSFADIGKRGAFLCEIEKIDGEIKVNAEFVKLAKREYFVCRVDVSGKNSAEEILSEALSSFNGERSENSMVRFIFVGGLTMGVELPISALRASLSSLGELDIKNQTYPAISSEYLLNDPTLKGEVRRALDLAINSDDELERETALLALKYIISALDGIDIADFGEEV